MAIALVDVFKERFEALKGHVHRAHSWEMASETIVSIVGEAGCVALAPLPPELSKALETRLANAGIETLRPPYRATELPGTLDRAEVGISQASFAIAETGTLVEITEDDAYRLVSALPRVHVCVVQQDAFVEGLYDAAPRLRQTFETCEGPCVVSMISGPSRTGDIEMILTLGVHGPEEAHAIVIDAPGGNGDTHG